MLYHEGDIVPSHFTPQIVAASYVASLCGCLLTVELLHRRRTGVYNWRSWLENFACAVSMGVIGIWCMHFIGNRAIILGNGASNVQLVYSPGYTTLSVFLPIIGLSIAFSTAEYPTQSRLLHWVGLVCTGTFAGLSICGMHYIANFGITDFELKYEPQFLAASIIIAVGDCLAVLILFYTWREKWINDWRKRALCAVFLAGGVSAMHFTASTHCIYVLRKHPTMAAIHRRDLQVIVAGILCGSAAVVVLGVLLFTHRRAEHRRESSQKVMLACAMFDPEDRLMVTTEGILPAREITEKYNHRTFDDDFDTSHPVFQWIFRVSRNWNSVSELIPKMKDHLGTRKTSIDGDIKSSRHSSSGFLYDAETYNDYSIAFRERFCTSAASLAAAMHISVEELGVLYDIIVDTGTLKPEHKRKSSVDTDRRRIDVETGREISLFGKGQLLFLTRRVNAEEAISLMNAGFKFASGQQIGRNVAETMQVPLATLEMHLTGLRRYIDDLENPRKHGTWLSCFALIPKPNSKGFDVVVERARKNQLPSVELLRCEPLNWQRAMLQQMDGLTPADCMTFLDLRQRKGQTRTPQEQAFAVIVTETIVRLGQQVPSAFFQQARFHGKAVYVHSSRPHQTSAVVTTLYSFVCCADLHSATDIWSGLTRIPLSFFKVRQQCYVGSADGVALSRDIHQEFGPLLARNQTRRGGHKASTFTAQTSKPSCAALVKSPSRRAHLAYASTNMRKESSIDTLEMIDKLHDASSGSARVHAKHDSRVELGGILVDSETVVNTDNRIELGLSVSQTERTLGMSVAVGTSQPQTTFVDELVAAARLAMYGSGGFGR